MWVLDRKEKKMHMLKNNNETLRETLYSQILIVTYMKWLL